jgi:hypothetical protein
MIPYTETEDPKRANLRKDIDDPKVRKSRTDREDPSLDIP